MMIEVLSIEIASSHDRLDPEGNTTMQSPPINASSCFESSHPVAERHDEEKLSPGPGSRLRNQKPVMVDPDIPPAFRIGMDNSGHSISSVSSPLGCDMKRSSKLADGYLEKISARKKSESQTMGRIPPTDRFEAGGSTHTEGSSSRVDNHTERKQIAGLSPLSSSSPRTLAGSVGSRKIRTSALAEAFLQKVKCPVDEEVIHHLKKVPTLVVVKKIKGRWPPKYPGNTTMANNASKGNNISEGSTSKRSLVKVSGAVVTSLKDCFENGAVFRNSPASDRIAERRKENGAIGSPGGVRRVRTSFQAVADQFGLPLWMNECSNNDSDANDCGSRGVPAAMSPVPRREARPSNQIATALPGTTAHEPQPAGGSSQETETLPPISTTKDNIIRDHSATAETPQSQQPIEPNSSVSDVVDDDNLSIDLVDSPQRLSALPSCSTMEVSSGTRSTLESTESGESDSVTDCPVSPLDFDTISTSSSSISDNLRPSYKVQYTGPRILRQGREWEDGVVDASFPALPRQNSFNSLEEDHRFDPEKPDSNMLFLPNERRFDRDRVDSVPKRVPVRKRSDLRFDPDASGICSLPGLPFIDRRFDGNASTDLSLPIYLGGAEGGEGDQHRFDRFENERSCLHAPKRPDRTDLTPSVWQTRASEPSTLVGDRKWRLKRIWEDKNNVVVDDSEPEYVVAEPQLSAALTSLLGVPESKVPLHIAGEVTKHWKVKTVWDRDGDVVQIDDEASVDCEELLVLFKRDYHRPREGIVFDYSAETLGLQRKVDDQPKIAECSSHTEYIDDDDGDDAASFDFDDSEHEYSNSLSCDDTQISDPDLLKQQLDEVEKEMNALILNKDNESREEARQKIVLLQGKLAMYLAQLQELEKEEYVDCYDNDDDDDDDDLSLDDGGRRDSKLIKKKLRKVERLMNSMIDKRGEKALRRKRYQRLESKRRQYLEELGLEEPSASSMVLESSIPTMRTSIHSVLENADLEVIEEESSLCSMEEKRDESLLRKKLQKVEKEMSRTSSDHSKKAKKLYRRLAEKRSQYLAELSDSPNEPQSDILQECIDEAIDVVNDIDGTSCNEDVSASPEAAFHSPKISSAKPVIKVKSPSEVLEQYSPKKNGPKYKYIKLKNYDVCGLWGSPLGKNTHKDSTC